jgi:hypothetical protein
VRQRYQEIRRCGAEVLAVTQARPEFLAAFLRDEPLPFPLVADPERAAYRAFGLERAAWATLFRPTVVWHYLRLLLRGWGLRWPRSGEDLRQLGGDFILDAQGRFVFAHRSAEPTDRPALTTLVKTLQDLGIADLSRRGPA